MFDQLDGQTRRQAAIKVNSVLIANQYFTRKTPHLIGSEEHLCPSTHY